MDSQAARGGNALLYRRQSRSCSGPPGRTVVEVLDRVDARRTRGACPLARAGAAGDPMAQIFHPSTNTIARVSIFGLVFFVAFVGWLAMALDRSPATTRERQVFEQPVPSSHKHHVTDDGIDCRYCHTSVEKSAFAGL